MELEQSHRFNAKAVRAVFLVCVPLAACTDVPARSECIVGYEMLWNVDADAQADVLNLLDLRDVGRTIPIAAWAAPDGVNLYLQFTRDCAKREAYAAAVIETWRRTVRGFPQVRPLSGPVTPSPETIDVTGRYWQD